MTLQNTLEYNALHLSAYRPSYVYNPIKCSALYSHNQSSIGCIRLPYNLYCVGGDLKHCSVQSNPAVTAYRL